MFQKKLSYFTVCLILCIGGLGLHCSPKQTSENPSLSDLDSPIPSKLPECEWCGAADAPPNLHWKSRIAPENEVGEALLLSGKVYQADGQTPAEGILIYAYHTNAQGLYAKKGNERGNALRHGYLRGWALSNAQGEYAFETIKPAPYPSRKEPAHIHMTLSSQHIPEYWLRATCFAGDSLIDLAQNRPKTEDDSSHIIRLKKDNSGVWRGQRDIILKKRDED